MSIADPRTDGASTSHAQPNDPTHSEPNSNIRVDINTEPIHTTRTEPIRDYETINIRNPRIREALDFVLQNPELVTHLEEFFTNSRVRPPEN